MRLQFDLKKKTNSTVFNLGKKNFRRANSFKTEKKKKILNGTVLMKNRDHRKLYYINIDIILYNGTKKKTLNKNR